MELGKLLFTFFDNAGPGGILVLLIFAGALSLYILLTRWIMAGRRDDETVRPVSTDS